MELVFIIVTLALVAALLIKDKWGDIQKYKHFRKVNKAGKRRRRQASKHA